jgi:EAL domain-containing protein (putative c-di-GMP-specific phosphodiesterase class I)
VKVDRSFITKLTHHSSERSIAEAIVSLATDLGLGVVAEGVETPQQLHQAHELGFSTIQGFHYSPALALTEILSDWIDDHGQAEGD